MSGSGAAAAAGGGGQQQERQRDGGGGGAAAEGGGAGAAAKPLPPGVSPEMNELLQRAMADKSSPFYKAAVRIQSRYRGYAVRKVRGGTGRGGRGEEGSAGVVHFHEAAMCCC